MNSFNISTTSNETPVASSVPNFSVTLKERVDEYFRTAGISTAGDSRMVLKCAVYLGGLFATYFWILSNSLSPLGMLGASMLLGFFCAAVGINIGHDAIHRALSKQTWLNKVMSCTFTFLGADVGVWRNLHNVIHHTYTNVPQADGDLHPVQWLRFFPKEGKKWLHQFQHFYAFGLYSLTTIVWVFQKDYVHIRKKQHLIYKKPRATFSDWSALLIGKAVYYAVFIVIPLIVLNVAWWQVAIGFVALHLVSGFCLAMVFQLGHLVEGTDFPSLGKDGRVQGAWLEHQLRTSADFATQSTTANFLFGGLNFQIEHHLFPTICHVHYPQIAPIVKKTAKEFGLPYVEFKTFRQALTSHRNHLRTTGIADAWTF